MYKFLRIEEVEVKVKIIYKHAVILISRAVVAKNRAGQKVTFSDHQVL